MRVAAYMRVSTVGQLGEDKFGLDAQKQMIEEYCAANDMEIVEWYTDLGKSGAKEREGFDRIVYEEATNPPIEAVVVAKTDRVARDMNLYYYYKMLLMKKDIELISVTEDFGAAGVLSKILESFVIAVAELERENINKRTSGGRRVKASKGGYSGGHVPYGYMNVSGRYEINEEQAENVRVMFAMRDDKRTMQEIADHLNGNGVKTRTGKVWTTSSVQYILNNRKTYEGWYHYGENDAEWVQGNFEPILK